MTMECIGKSHTKQTSVCEESTIDLLKQLIEHTLIEVKPKETQVFGKHTIPTKNQLKSNILNILFSSLHDPNHNKEQLSEFEQLTWMTYILSQKHEYDKAHQLSLCVDQLQKIDERQELNELPSILKILIALSKPSSSKSVTLFEPWIIAKKDEKWNLPNEPLNYGDTRLHASENWFYVHYPPHLFDDRNLNKLVAPAKKEFSKCDLEPGSVKEAGKNSANRKCLGAMLNPYCFPNPGTVLSIPDLPERKAALEIASIFRSCLPSSVSIHPEQETDEGYASSQCSVTSDVSEIPEFYNVHAKTPEKSKKLDNKFITESSPDVVKRLWSLNHYNWNILSEYPISPIWDEKSQSDLCNNILYLLVGVESDGFRWTESENTFLLKEGICCEGITPGAIKGHCEEFIICGNKIRRLEKICSDTKNMNKGLVWNALIRSIKSFLFIFRKKVLSYNGGLLPMKSVFAGLLSKLHFLGATCDHLLKSSFNQHFGLGVINLLLQKMRTATNRSNSYLILSILNSCCQPFFHFLERWIYCGENYDPFGEFFISSDTATLWFKDNRYWQDGHTLLTNQFNSADPVIKVLMEQAFMCGKATSFLAAFAPNHSLILEGKANHPRISFGWSNKLFDYASKTCEDFYLKVKITSESLTEMLLEEYDDMCREKQIALINAASDQRIKTMEKLNETINVKNLKIRKRKSMAMEALIKDMNEAREQKLARENAERVMDEKIDAERHKMELLDQQNANKIRNDMINNYQEYLVESNRKEVLLKEKLKTLNLVSDGTTCKEDVGTTPVGDMETNVTIIYPDIQGPLGLVEMSITPDDVSPVRIDGINIKHEISSSHINTNSPMVKSNANIDAVNNRTNMMNSNILNAVNLGDTKLVPDRKTNSDYIREDKLNHNVIVTKNVANIEAPSNNKDINLNVSNYRTTLIASSTTPNNSVITEVEPECEMSVVSESIMSDQSVDNSHMSASTSIESFPVFSTMVGTSIGSMKKSKSDTFFTRKPGSHEKIAKRPKSCLFEETNPNNLPVLRDQDDISYREKCPKESFVDKDLLEARYLESTSKLSAYNVELRLCDELPECNPLLKEKGCTSSNDGDPQDKDISTAINYITRTISLHVASQSIVVNEAIFSHLLIHQGMLKDFSILHSVMLSQDISINRSLVLNLVNKLTPCCNPSTLLTPNELNNVLNESLNCSHLGKELSGKVFFVVTKVPTAFKSPYDIWDCVQLRYKIQWPNSVVIDRLAIEKYIKIWRLLMKIHHSVFAMDELYRLFRRKSIRFRNSNSQQVHQLSVMAYEIQNFIRVILSYISHQGIQTSLSNFEKSLRKGNLTVDDLYEVHSEFLNDVLAKCFLNEKGSLIHNIVIDILARAHKFCALLNASTFEDGVLQCNAFNEAKKLSSDIKKMSLFMTKLLRKVSMYTRVDHIEAFYLQLNFNENYQI